MIVVSFRARRPHLSHILMVCVFAMNVRAQPSPAPKAAAEPGGPEQTAPANGSKGEDAAPDANTKAEEFESSGLDLAWVLDGKWLGVAADNVKGVAYTINAAGECVEVSTAGKVLRQFKLESGGTSLRTANLAGNSEKEILSYRLWGDSLKAFSTEGGLLWEHMGGQGIDDVWAADISGDGMDEIIVGYNGSTGLQVLDHRGKPLWKYEKIGNVWYVCAGNVRGDEDKEVLSTSATGAIHVFAADGRELKQLSAGNPATLVRAVRAASEDDFLAIVVGTVQDKRLGLAAMDLEGTKRWTLDLPNVEPAQFDSAMPAPERSWLGIGLSGGLVVVVNVNDGRIIARARHPGQRSEVDWLAGEKGSAPLLLVSSGKALRSYRLIEH